MDKLHSNQSAKRDILLSSKTEPFEATHNILRDLGSSQGCIFRLTCSYPELTKDHVLTSAYVNIFRTVTRNAVNKSV